MLLDGVNDIRIFYIILGNVSLKAEDTKLRLILTPAKS